MRIAIIGMLGRVVMGSTIGIILTIAIVVMIQYSSDDRCDSDVRYDE